MYYEKLHSKIIILPECCIDNGLELDTKLDGIIEGGHNAAFPNKIFHLD